MERKMHRKKIITIFFSIVFVFSLVFPYFSAKAAISDKLNWENPNKSGYNNPYKFDLSTVLNSQVLMQVVGSASKSSSR